MSFKIYTKTGDKGTTGLFGGARLPKHHLRIESYGTIDELNANLGMLRDLWNGSESSLLPLIQEQLFTIGAQLATDPQKESPVPGIQEAHIQLLENAIDEMDAQLEPLKNFVLPGGHVTISQAHICRCVCRRAERLVVALQENEPVDSIIVPYLNRLSDYLFVLSRFIAFQLQVPEVTWKGMGD